MTCLDSSPLIRATTKSRCALCGNLGEPLYSNLEDKLFGVSGMWGLARCSDRLCGLVWLNPMPLAEDLKLAYRDYYTHAGPTPARHENVLKRAYRAIKRDYLGSRYGYRTQRVPLGSWGWLLYLFPLRRTGVESDVRYLAAVPGGRLLDVGCGSGAWLADMRELGWEVRGIDFDAEAVVVAARRGLAVDRGSLEQQCYPDATFDVITLNHVIEHLPDPQATLAECLRLLTPGGHLILVTPNCDSLGHLLFKQAWRGLEPPRHLHLFCPNSMRKGLRRAGFSQFEVRTVNSPYILRGSLSLRVRLAEGGRHLKALLSTTSYLLALIEQAMIAVRPDLGECLVVRATKR